MAVSCFGKNRIEFNGFAIDDYWMLGTIEVDQQFMNFPYSSGIWGLGMTVSFQSREHNTHAAAAERQRKCDDLGYAARSWRDYQPRSRLLVATRRTKWVWHTRDRATFIDNS